MSQEKEWMLHPLTCFNFIGTKIFLLQVIMEDRVHKQLAKAFAFRPFSFIFFLTRWDYSNSGYLDALKHLTDLKEEGYFVSNFFQARPILYLFL